MPGFFDFISKLIPWKRTLTGGPLAGGKGSPPAAPPSAPAPPSGPAEEWALSGTWLKVGSSNVSEIRYLWDAQILEVEFLGVSPQGDGYHYQYMDVPPSVAEAMSNASSPGRFVWRHLRDVYPYVRLRGISAGTSRTPTVIRPRHDIDPASVGLFGVPDWMKKT